MRWIWRVAVVFAVLLAFCAERRVRRGDGDDEVGGGSSERDTLGGVTAPTNSTARSAAVRMPDIKVIAPGKLRLEGLVIDADDRPVAGAKVAISPERTTVTEADGSFAFDDLAEGEYDLTAEAGDAFVEDQGVTLDETSDPVTLQLVRGPTLVIHVVDDTKKPIAGAKVAIIGREHVAGEDGTVRMRGVALDDELVIITAAGHAMRREHLETSDDPSAVIERTFVLGSGAEIAGTVVGPDGKPVKDAYVELEPVGGGRTESVNTDERGAWALPDIGRGRFVARASSSDSIAAADVPVEHDGAHATRGLVLRLEAGGEIAGIVVDTSDHPVADARITGSSIAEKTDKDGRFVARGLPPQKYTLSVSTDQLGAPDTDVTLARGQHATVKLVVVPSSIAGTVVDARGQPVEDASVSARMDPGGYGFARSDAYGHFDTGGLPPGRYVVTASRDGSNVDSKEVEVRTGERQVRLVVPDPAAITGRVVMDGRPVPYYGVAIVDHPEETSFGRPDPIRDPDGRFTHKDAKLGTFAVVIVGPSFARKVIENVRVESGRVTDLGDIVVETGPRIRGRVRDDRGGAVAGATVRLVKGRSVRDSETSLAAFSRGEPFAVTNAMGEYELFGAEPTGPDETAPVLQATHPLFGASALHEIVAGETNVDLTLLATGSIEGHIAHRLPDMTIIATSRTDDTGLRSYSDVDGDDTFRIEGLTPGEYKIEILGHTTLPSQKVIVTAGRPAPVVFVAPEHPVIVRLHRPSCGLFSLRTPDDELLAVTSCTDGVATLPEVAAGPYLLCPEMEDCRTITVPEQPEYDLTISN